MAEKVTLLPEFVVELDEDYYEGWRLEASGYANRWRWGTEEWYVVQRESDGKFFMGTLRFHTTEGLEGNDGPETFTAVKRVERVITDWEEET